MGKLGKLAIDFDGTLAVEGIDGELVPTGGAAKALTALKDAGWYIVIHTCRTTVAKASGNLAHEIEMISDFLSANHIPFDEIYSGSKFIADLYVDDRAIRFQGNWNQVLKEVALHPRKK